jgi:small subunit ribosomal protein S8
VDTWETLECAVFALENRQSKEQFLELENHLGNTYIMDSVANTLTTVLNGQRVGKERVAVPYAKFTKNLLDFLKKEELIGDVRIQESPISKLIVSLSYNEKGVPKISGAKRISKPGRRVYAGGKNLPYTQQDQGMIIVSTPEGLMDEKHARGKGIGGELICAIW